jgi:hypothetical protein
MCYVSLINMIDQVFPSHGSMHLQLRVFVYMYALSPTTCALQIAFHIPHTYYYQHMSFPTTLQHKKTQLIINSSIDIRFDWFSLIIFSLHNRSQLLMLFYYFCNRPTQFVFLFLLQRNRSNLLADSLLYLFTVGFDCLIPTKWLERSKLQISKLSSLYQLSLFVITYQFFSKNSSCEVLFFLFFLIYKGTF